MAKCKALMASAVKGSVLHYSCCLKVTL